MEIKFGNHTIGLNHPTYFNGEDLTCLIRAVVNQDPCVDNDAG